MPPEPECSGKGWLTKLGWEAEVGADVEVPSWVFDNDLSVNQVLDSSPQSETTIHRVPYDLMEVAEKIRFVPMWKRVQRWANLGEPEE